MRSGDRHDNGAGGKRMRRFRRPLDDSMGDHQGPPPTGTVASSMRPPSLVPTPSGPGPLTGELRMSDISRAAPAPLQQIACRLQVLDGLGIPAHAATPGSWRDLTPGAREGTVWASHRYSFAGQ